MMMLHRDILLSYFINFSHIGTPSIYVRGYLHDRKRPDHIIMIQFFAFSGVASLSYHSAAAARSPITRRDK